MRTNKRSTRELMGIAQILDYMKTVLTVGYGVCGVTNQTVMLNFRQRQCNK